MIIRMRIRRSSPARALRTIKLRRKVFTAAQFEQGIRDASWIGHIGRSLLFEPSCGCGACEAIRMNRKK